MTLKDAEKKAKQFLGCSAYTKIILRSHHEVGNMVVVFKGASFEDCFKQLHQRDEAERLEKQEEQSRRDKKRAGRPPSPSKSNYAKALLPTGNRQPK